VPSLVDVVWIVKDDQPLNLSSGQKRGVGSPSLPSENAKPANYEADEFLMLGGCKFRNPVILTARRGSPVSDGSACKNRIEVSMFKERTLNPSPPSKYSHT
jgi:hypothetical protein